MIQLWVEGYNENGIQAKAYKFHESELDDIVSAVAEWSEKHKEQLEGMPEFFVKDALGVGRHTIFGCEVFISEVDARKKYG